jgi:large subunit ribosomal protein L15
MKFKRKKTRRKRGSTFHGWGRGAAHHKGAGNRGGRGRAGTGKKADQVKPSYWTEPVGKHGFTSKNNFKISAININEINAKMESWIKKGFASKKDKGFEVDLKKAGYDKLLGQGNLNSILFITTDFASKGAVEKIKAFGGNVTVLKKKVKKEKKQKQAAKPAKKANDKQEAESADEE